MAAASTMKMGDAAERSPTVYYANLKEDMLLKKKLHVLNRSEKSFVHRIRIDQKVLYKRFQNKLHRSKLAEARMWGNKELERELRAKNLHGLNSQNGDSEEDYDFLKKLEKPKPRKPKTRFSVPQIDTIIEDVLEVMKPGKRPRSRSFSDALPLQVPNTKEKAPRPNKLDIAEVALAVRPSTTDGIRVGDSISDENTKTKIQRSLSKPEKNKKLTIESKYQNLLQVPLIDTRARTCAPLVSRKVETPLPALQSRRQSTASPDKTKRKSASFFEPEEKVDLVEIRLNEMKGLDYTDRLQEYYETLESCTNPEEEKLDYYTFRLQVAKQQLPKNRPLTVPGTPETEYKRHMGNVEVKSLTFRGLNLDFSRRDHASENSEMWSQQQLPVLILSSDEESSDDESTG